MGADRTPPTHDLVTVAYAILRTHPNLNLEGFAARLGMDVQEAAALLDQLVDLSLVRRHDESGRFYVPTTPLMAMQQIIQRERAALDARRQSLNESYEILSEFMADLPDPPAPAPPPTGTPGIGRSDPGAADNGTAGPGSAAPGSAAPAAAGLRTAAHPAAGFDAAGPGPAGSGRAGAYATAERLEGVAAVRTRLQELADQACQEVLSFAPPARDSTAARHASRRPDLEVLDRGVTTRTLYLDTIVSEPSALAYATDLIDAGGQVRLVPHLPIRLIIIDHRVAAIPIDPSDGTAGALILHDAGTISAMAALFEAYWRDGRPIPGQPDAAEASATDIAILRLLASGAKDEAVARSLGVSVRTVRRGIANLMDRLHAESRFELAVRAAGRGLLD